MSYAIALDVGTTTISGSLLDLEEKIVKKRFSSLNGQISYGHDIITRLNHALNKKNGLERLARSIISSINFVLDNLLQDAGINKNAISTVLAVGNPVMHHFIFSLPLASFVKPPYKPFDTNGIKKEAGQLGINSVPKACFRMLPNIAGFIGSDAIAVILVTSLHKSSSFVLAMDIGTNGEILLGSREKILACSTAAGPAFEGWHISCGMRPVSGAIESADDKNGIIQLRTIGDMEPKGISGSGLIDLLGILLKRGEIDGTGKLGEAEFVVCEKPDRIVLTQEDIREAQLAKAAFSVGVRFLRRMASAEISKVYITGAFGSYLNKESARLVGLIPQDVELKRVEFISQGALRGAEMVLNNPELENDINDILTKTEYISLAEDRDFQNEFVSAMHFLNTD